MNKWMVRFWGLLALVSLAMLIATTAWPRETATREDLQRALARLQAVTAEYFDHPRSAKTAAYIERGHASIREVAKASPDEWRLAQVIFRRGLTSNELHELSGEFHLAVHEAELTFLDREKDFASTVPTQTFWRGDGTSGQVIERCVAEHRAAFALRATELRKDSQPQAARLAGYFERLSKKGEPVLVSMGVTAKVDMLRLVSEEADVYAVVMDPSPESARRLAEMRDRMTGRPAIQDIPEL